MLGPIPFFHGIPITFVSATQASLLLRQPPRIRLHVQVGGLRQRGILALRSGIDAKAGSNRLWGNAYIQLAGFAFASKWRAEFQVHLRTVWRFVPGKADIAIDPR